MKVGRTLKFFPRCPPQHLHWPGSRNTAKTLCVDMWLIVDTRIWIALSPFSTSYLRKRISQSSWLDYPHPKFFPRCPSHWPGKWQSAKPFASTCGSPTPASQCQRSSQSQRRYLTLRDPHGTPMQMWKQSFNVEVTILTQYLFHDGIWLGVYCVYCV